MRLVIGSRGSQLALWQANWVKNQLTAAGHEVEIRVIKTTGDKLASLPLMRSRTKGLFIKEIEEALLAGEVDVAVHSMKDLPTELPKGLAVGAVPAREDARDVLISRDGRVLAELRAGSRVGTSSLRRQSQLRRLRPDLDLRPMRGNLDTRLKKLQRGDCDAIVVAAAGVHRLGLKPRVTEYFSPEQVCPAVGQGALAVEIREDDAGPRAAAAPLDHAPTHLAVRAERAMLRSLGGGCQVPIAAHAVAQGHVLRLLGVVASLDGSALVRASRTDAIQDPEKLGVRVAQDLLERDARSILRT